MTRYYLPYREGCHPDAYGGANILAKLKASSVLERVRTANQFGWRNQPPVFTFSSKLDLFDVNKAIEATGLTEYYTWFPRAQIKDWK